MAIKTKDELVSEFDSTVIDGGEATAAEFRTLNENTVDSMDTFKTPFNSAKGTYKATGNTDYATDETNDKRFLIVNGLIMQQVYTGGAWTTMQIVVPYGTKLLFKANGNSNFVTPETNDTYWEMQSNNEVIQVVV